MILLSRGLLAGLKNSRLFWFGISLGAILLCIAISYQNNLIPDFFVGEEYDKIRYPALNNHLASWVSYFLDKGRPIEGIYWTYLYKIVGFQPKIFHLASIVLHLIATLLATIVFCRTLSKTGVLTNNWRLSILIVVLFFNAYSVNLFFKISLDAPIIAVATFFASTFAFQSFARSDFTSYGWLLVTILMFLFTIFNYEVAVFLFPATLLLSWPLLSETRRTKRLAYIFILAGFTSCLVVLIPYKIYALIETSRGIGIANPAMSAGSQSISSLISQVPQRYVSYLTEFGEGLYAQGSWQRISLYGLVVLFLLGTFLLFRALPLKGTARRFFEDPKYASLLAALWITTFSLLPYALIGYFANSIRAFSAAIFGILIFVSVTVLFEKRRLFRSAGLLLLLLSVAIGINQFFLRSRDLMQLREHYFSYFIDFAKLVPGILPGTNLVLIEHNPGSLSGCPGMFMLLYNVKDITCGVIGTEPVFMAERFESVIHAHYGGWLRGDNEVLVGRRSSGEFYLIDSIESSSHLLVTWHVTDPIKTDYTRIVRDRSAPNSEMYFYLIDTWGSGN